MNCPLPALARSAVSKTLQQVTLRTQFDKCRFQIGFRLECRPGSADISVNARFFAREEMHLREDIEMNNSERAMALSFGLVLFLTVLGCHGSRVIVGEHPHYEVAEDHGPPPWAPAHGYRAKHHYYYYPASSVYFDVGRGLYFFYQGDGWRVGASLPAGFQINVNDYVELDMDTDRPYVYHTDVMKRYPPGQAKKLGMGKGKWK
jgi:hypothetical protein